MLKFQQVSPHCYAVLNEKNRLCDSNSGFINSGGGAVIDTQSDLAHARQLIELLRVVSPSLPKYVINTHEDIDHVGGNQLFEDAQIIGHKTLPDRIKEVADPMRLQKLLHGVKGFWTRLLLKFLHPGLTAVGQQLGEDYNFDDMRVAPPTTLLDERHDLNLDGIEVQLIYVGPAHQMGDVIVHVPQERVVFSGDIIFQKCTPMGWVGTYENWLKALDLIIALNPESIVPGHGPVCSVEDAKRMKAYLNYVRAEAKKGFDQGLTSIDVAKRIDFRDFGEWHCPSRIYCNIERAYREFSGEPLDAPWQLPKVFDTIYHVARYRRLETVF
ncbi:MAG: MBL fold metallo-hydrolase [Gemmataceae bacterium]